MAEVESFSAKQVELHGCAPLAADCGLVAEDVQVKLGEEKFSWDTGRWMTACKAKIGSIACETCGLRQMGVVQDVQASFEMERDLDDPAEANRPRMLSAMTALPQNLARVLFCQSEQLS